MPLRLDGSSDGTVRVGEADNHRVQHNSNDSYNGHSKRAAMLVENGMGRGVRRRAIRIEGCTTSRMMLAAIFVAAVIAAFVTLDQNFLEDTMEWMQSSAVQGPALFVLLYSAAVVLLVPGTLLALCAGAMFKWEAGTLLVWLGQSIGQVFAFVIGRYLLRDVVVANVVTRYRKFAAVDKALEREGWKLVVLLRLSPIVPWNMLNYLLSVTGVPLFAYSWASSVAVLPWLSLFTYVGSMAHTLADVLNGNVSPDTTTSLLIGVVSGVLLIAAVLYTGYVSKRAIAEAFRDGGSGGGSLVGEESSGSDRDSATDDEEASLLTTAESGAGAGSSSSAPAEGGRGRGSSNGGGTGAAMNGHGGPPGSVELAEAKEVGGGVAQAGPHGGPSFQHWLGTGRG